MSNAHQQSGELQSVDVENCSISGPYSIARRFPARCDQGDNSHDATPDDVLAAFETMSRRIEDLARELKCLGYFDDDGDRPRAA